MDNATPRAPAAVRLMGMFIEAVLFACKWVAIGLVAVIAGIVIMSVIFRYVLNDSLAWSEDAAKFLMVWMTFVAAPLGFRHGAHVAIDLLPPGLPPAFYRAVRALVHLIVLVLMVVLTWQSWLFAVNGWSQVALTIGDISMFWIFVSVPVGSAIMALVALELLVLTVLGVPEPAITDSETVSTN